MKTIPILKSFISGIILLIVSSCASKPDMILENPSDSSRTDEPVILTRNYIQKTIGEIPDDELPVLRGRTGEIIPSQADDLDGDGQWDEIFLLVDIGKGQKLEVYTEFMEKSEIPEFPTRSNVRFGDANEPYQELDHVDRLKSTESPVSSAHFQMEGPAWENDRVGFRNYFDARNGMDIFGKRVNEMVLDSVGIDDQDYHTLDDWGMDILKVGNSLGSGAIALKKGDEIFRIDSAREAKYNLLTDGPLRSVFELSFKGFSAEDRLYDIVHRVSIWGGWNGYKSQVTVTPVAGEHLITGIVNMHSDTLYQDETEEHIILATHDNQAYDGEKLGMAMIVGRDDFVQTLTAPDEGEGIIQTYMAELIIEGNKPVSFYFFVGWELQNDKFASADFFRDFLKKQAERLAEPVMVRAFE